MRLPSRFRRFLTLDPQSAPSSPNFLPQGRSIKKAMPEGKRSHNHLPAPQMMTKRGLASARRDRRNVEVGGHAVRSADAVPIRQRGRDDSGCGYFLQEAGEQL